MGFLDRINKTAPTPTVNREITNGAYGGVVPRTFPTITNPIYGSIPIPQLGGGITSRIAQRPNSAPMLKSATYHTQIPGIGLLMGMPTVDFKRGTTDVHRAAVSDVQHVKAIAGVHPTTVRQVRRGVGSL